MEERILTEKIIAEFAEHLIDEEKSDNTVGKYIRDVRAFAGFAGSGKVTGKLVSEYREALLKAGYAARSINSMLAGVNCLLGFLGWEDCRARAVRIQRQVYCPEERELTKVEYERLCRAAGRKGDERLKLLLQTICSTGIRVSELRYITVEAAKRGEVSVSLKGKTRTVFLVRQLRKRLLRYASVHGIKSGNIFVTRTGRPLSRTNIWREMKNLCNGAKVDSRKVFPHNLRRLFARTFYEMEKDIAKLADIMGHSNMETTRIYIVSTGAEHRRKLEKMRLIM